MSSSNRVSPKMELNEIGHLVQVGCTSEEFLKSFFYICSQTLTMMHYASARAKKNSAFIRFSNMERLNEYVNRIKTNLQSSADEKAKRKAEKAELTQTAEIGDVFVSTWGWEQTNVDYFQVVGLKGKKSYILRKICQKHLEAEGCSSMSCYVLPVVNDFYGEDEYIGRITGENRIKVDRNYANLKSYTLNGNNERVYSKDYKSWYG